MRTLLSILLLYFISCARDQIMNHGSFLFQLDLCIHFYALCTEACIIMKNLWRTVTDFAGYLVFTQYGKDCTLYFELALLRIRI